jgi:hypothetical protein
MEMIRSSQEGQTLLSQEELHRINLKEAEKTPIIH